MKFSFGIKDGKLNISSEPVGQSTNSKLKDFYVYEWYIKKTGEIFYVGKGRGNRHNEYHSHAYVAEKIRDVYETDVKFVAKNLTEEQAIELESEEMTRILNETSDHLTNRIIPFFTKRDNGYGRSPNTPRFEFEKAPHLYACEIDEHYFNVKCKPFDHVQLDLLKNVYFIDKRISDDVLKIVYGGNFERYYNETMALLEGNGHKIIKTQYAKSVTAWIYCDDDDVTNNSIAQDLAINRIGRNVPSYHLLDVWKLLKSAYGDAPISESVEVAINPIHNRMPLDKIKNANNWDAGFDAGYTYWEQGEVQRKSGNIENAIKLFDEARYKGYCAPALYNSYALAYRKAKDYDNEVAILDEGITRIERSDLNVHTSTVIKWKEQRKKALEKIKKPTSI